MKAIVARPLFFLTAASLCFAQATAEKQNKSVPAAGTAVEKAGQGAPKRHEQMYEFRDAARIGDSKETISVFKYDSEVVGSKPFLKDLVDTSTRRIRDLPNIRLQLAEPPNKVPEPTPNEYFAISHICSGLCGFDARGNPVSRLHGCISKRPGRIVGRRHE